MRLHTRTIIRDGRQAFVGSQSLRKLELDSRREVGLIVRQAGVVRRLIATFDHDWVPVDPTLAQANETTQNNENVQKAVKIFMKELPPLSTTVKKAVKKVVEVAGQDAIAEKTVKQAVKKVVKKAVKEAIKEIADAAAPDAAVT